MREFLISAASIIGFALIVLGIVLLVYYVSPVRFMLGAFVPHKSNPTPPILGGIALISGIALVYAARTRD
jgi:amino acid permease